MKKRVVIVGMLPAPIGGVSIHVMRLSAEFAKRGYNVTVFNLSADTSAETIEHLERLGVVIVDGANLSSFKLATTLFKTIKNHDVVNTHTKHWIVFLILILTKALKRKVEPVLTLHSFRENLDEIHFILKMSFLWGFKAMSRIFVTNNEIKEKLSLLGIDEKKVFVSKTFISPLDFEYSSVPKKVSTFIDNKFPIMSANAYKLRFYNEEDLYGFDLCIKLTSDLKAAGYNPAFVFSLPDIGEEDYFAAKMQEISDLNINDNIMVLKGPHSFIPILSMSDIFIRPTNTDGDSISIRESLALNKLTVSSDIVQRPKGVVIFRNRDSADLLTKIITLCEGLRNNVFEGSQQENKCIKKDHENTNDAVKEIIDIIVAA